MLELLGDSGPRVEEILHSSVIKVELALHIGREYKHCFPRMQSTWHHTFIPCVHYNFVWLLTLCDVSSWANLHLLRTFRLFHLCCFCCSDYPNGKLQWPQGSGRRWPLWEAQWSRCGPKPQLGSGLGGWGQRVQSQGRRAWQGAIQVIGRMV